MDRKARCHVIFDQISQDVGIGTFGVNMVESLAQSKLVIGDINKFTHSTYPALRDCVTYSDADTLEYRLREICGNRGLWRDNGLHLNPQGWEYAKRTWDVGVVGLQWQHLMEFIHEELGGDSMAQQKQ